MWSGSGFLFGAKLRDFFLVLLLSEGVLSSMLKNLFINYIISLSPYCCIHFGRDLSGRIYVDYLFGGIAGWLIEDFISGCYLTSRRVFLEHSILTLLRCIVLCFIE